MTRSEWYRVWACVRAHGLKWAALPWLQQCETLQVARRCLQARG